MITKARAQACAVCAGMLLSFQWSHADQVVQVPGSGRVAVELALVPRLMDPTHAVIDMMRASFSMYHLVNEKPPSITKEPMYAGKARYGAFQLGNGPRSLTYFVIDDAEGKLGKIYVDTNQNGDLTDDGPGDWKSWTDSVGKPCNQGYVTARASWGQPMHETESENVELELAFNPGRDGGLFIEVTGRAGEMKLAGKSYPIVLASSMNDAIYTVPADADLTRGEVLLYIDTESDKPFVAAAPGASLNDRRHPKQVNIAHPFELDGHWYMARPSISGSTLTVIEVTKPGNSAATTQPAEEELKTVAIGSPAPNFTIQSPDGKALSLSDFKGKVVIIDFWATWCGPCQAAMPGLEALYQKVKDQEVVVLSTNVLDDRAMFDKWIEANAGTRYHFTFGYDPAGKSRETSIATSKYGAMAIPFVVVVGRDGKVVANLLGGDEHDITKALATQGVKAPEK